MTGGEVSIDGIGFPLTKFFEFVFGKTGLHRRVGCSTAERVARIEGGVSAGGEDGVFERRDEPGEAEGSCEPREEGLGGRLGVAGEESVEGADRACFVAGG
jgi:hypothetical protein